MTHTTYALGGEHARSVLEGMECVHCEPFLWEKLRSCSSLFLRELGRSSAPRGSGPAAAEAVKGLSSRRSQMELALRGEHVHSVLEGMECVHCEPFLWEKLRSCSSLFLRELGRSSAPHSSGPAAAEAVKRLSLRRSQMGLA